MIDLDPMSVDDASLLADLLEQHHQNTGSTVARFILDDFENQLENFVKVFPKDYKKVLQQKETATQTAH
jgi:glutamate synthase (NADPH/NADH) large chain